MGCGRCDNISRSVTVASFTDDPTAITKECVAMLKHLAVTVSDIRGMGIQINKLSTDNRLSSSSKTLHDFMKPSAKTARKLPTVSDENADVCTSVDRCKDLETVVSSGFQGRPCTSRTLAEVPTDSDEASDVIPKHDGRMCRSETVDYPLIDVPSSGFLMPENLGENHDVGTVENDNDFSLVLSELDLNEPALHACQRITEHKLDAPACDAGQQNRKQDSVAGCETSSSVKKTDFPALPVFPIFSPVRTTPKKGSPARSKKRSPACSPGRAGKRSPGRSPVRPTSQRSLLGIFQSPAGRDVATSLSLPSPSQIDPAVFEALPDEIKKDIEMSYQQRNQKFTLGGDGAGGGDVGEAGEVQVTMAITEMVLLQ